MKEMGVAEYRTSISMSRMLKENGEVNLDAMQWYKEYFGALNEAGIKVYPTLYHWELPQHLADKGAGKIERLLLGQSNMPKLLRNI